MILSRFIAFAALLAAVRLGAAAPPLEPPAPDELIELQALAPGEAEYNPALGTALITNTFALRFRDASLTADRGELDGKTGRVRVEGNVVLQRRCAHGAPSDTL